MSANRAVSVCEREAFCQFWFFVAQSLPLLRRNLQISMLRHLVHDRKPGARTGVGALLLRDTGPTIPPRPLRQ